MSEEVPALSKDGLSTSRNSNTLTKLQTYLNGKRCSCCFNLHPLASARIVNEREMSGYVAHLWTLNESRWTSEERAPCYGDEPSPNGPVGDIWHDYHFDPPTKTLLDKGESSQAVRDLKETQRRERCSKCECLGEIKCPTCSGFGRCDCEKCHHQGAVECCHNEKCLKCEGEGFAKCVECSGEGKFNCPKCLTRGRIPCPDCKGLRFVLVWTQLHVKWENQNSSMTRDLGNSTILPASEIEKSSGKVTCLEFDDVWSSSTQSIDSVLDNCVGLPRDLRAKIQEQYQTKHCDKSGKIIRLRCIIQCLHMKEIDYTFDQMSDETFTFCVYGEEETHVYDNQYPYKCCGRRSCTIL